MDVILKPCFCNANEAYICMGSYITRNSSTLGASDITLDSIIEDTNKFGDPDLHWDLLFGIAIQFEILWPEGRWIDLKLVLDLG